MSQARGWRAAAAASAGMLLAGVAVAASPSLEALPAAAPLPLPGIEAVPRARCSPVPGRACLVDVAALIASAMSDPAWRGYSLAACAAAATGGAARRMLLEAGEAERRIGDDAGGLAARASLQARLGGFGAALSLAASVAEPGRRALAHVAVAAAALESSAKEEAGRALSEALAAAMAVADPWQRAVVLASIVEPSMRLGMAALAREAGWRAEIAIGEIGDGWMRMVASARVAEARAVLGDASGAVALALAVTDPAARERGLSRVAAALAATAPGDARRAVDALSDPLARADALAALAAAGASRSREDAAVLLGEARSLIARVAGADRYDFAAALQRVALAEMALGDNAAAATTLGVALGAIAAIPEEDWRAQALGDIVATILALP